MDAAENARLDYYQVSQFEIPKVEPWHHMTPRGSAPARPCWTHQDGGCWSRSLIGSAGPRIIRDRLVLRYRSMMDEMMTGEAAVSSTNGTGAELVTLRFRWRPAGNLRQDSAGKLIFPPVGNNPGVYRLEVDYPHDAVYFGEATELDRRFARYRNPGPKQPTNVRLNEVLLSALRSDGSCRLSVAEILKFQTGSMESPLDLRLKAARVLVESYAIVLARNEGTRAVLNLDPAFDRSYVT